MDVLFVDEVDVEISVTEGRRCLAVAESMEESLRTALALKGIELIDYGTVQFRFPAARPGVCVVEARSKAWREKIQRTPTSA